MAKGDLGYSQSNGAPIAALIADRAPETLREIGDGARWQDGFPGWHWRFGECAAFSP